MLHSLGASAEDVDALSLAAAAAAASSRSSGGAAGGGGGAGGAGSAGASGATGIFGINAHTTTTCPASNGIRVDNLVSETMCSSSSGGDSGELPPSPASWTDDTRIKYFTTLMSFAGFDVELAGGARAVLHAAGRLHTGSAVTLPPSSAPGSGATSPAAAASAAAAAATTATSNPASSRLMTPTMTPRILRGALGLLEESAMPPLAPLRRRVGMYTVTARAAVREAVAVAAATGSALSLHGTRAARVALWMVKRDQRNWSKEAMVRYPHRAEVVARRQREQGRFS